MSRLIHSPIAKWSFSASSKLTRTFRILVSAVRAACAGLKLSMSQPPNENCLSDGDAFSPMTNPLSSLRSSCSRMPCVLRDRRLSAPAHSLSQGVRLFDNSGTLALYRQHARFGRSLEKSGRRHSRQMGHSDWQGVKILCHRSCSRRCPRWPRDRPRPQCDDDSITF